MKNLSKKEFNKRCHDVLSEYKDYFFWSAEVNTEGELIIFISDKNNVSYFIKPNISPEEKDYIFGKRDSL